MSQNIVAKRYAEALFLSANEQNKLEDIRKELNAVYGALVNHSDFFVLLKNPKLTKEAKKDLVKDAFSSCSQVVINTLFLLIDRKREDIILELIENYFERANEAQGLADAKVYSVRPLSEDEEKALSQSFAKKVGKKELHITNIVDESLLGGLKIRIGNTIFDGTVQGKLERIERQLVSAKR